MNQQENKTQEKPLPRDTGHRLQNLPQPQIPDHELLRCIGSGSYGEVWLARNVMGTYRAVKVVYRLTFENERPYEREFNGMKKFEPVSRSHDALVDILQIGRNDTAGYYYYIMELGDDLVSGPEIDPDRYEAKTLAKVLHLHGRLPYEECVQLGVSLAAGLGRLHSHGLIHRDLKPSNIIFVNGMPKIADIGLVAEVGSSRSFVGTEGFIPPEGPGTTQADVYSLGKVLYELSSGKDRQTYPELPTNLGDLGEKEYLELNAVILKACDNEPRRRYRTADELRGDLLLLQAGRSVRRLRTLERRLTLLKRLGIAVGLLVFVGAMAGLQVHRGRQIAVRSLTQTYVANGTRFMDQGDMFNALPWLTEALRINQGRPTLEEPHRLRVNTALKLCPKPVCTVFEPFNVYCADVSPDGEHLVVVGNEVEPALLSSPDSSRILLPHERYWGDVFRVSSGERVLRFQGHIRTPETVEYSPDGQQILTASGDGTARLWDARTGQELVALRMQHPPDEAVFSAHFNPQGDRIITACADGRARIWDAGTGSLLTDFMAHEKGGLRHADFSPDGCSAVTAGEDGVAQLWDLRRRTRCDPAFHHESWVYQACFSPDGRYVLTTSYDRSARAWDIRTGLQIRRCEHNGPIHSAQFSPDGRYVVTGGWEEYTAQIWDFKTGWQIHPALRHSGNLMHAQFLPDGRRVVTASFDHSARIWDLAATNWPTRRIDGQFSQDGKQYAVSSENEIRVCSTESGQATGPVICPQEVPIQITLDPRGHYLFLATRTDSAEASEELNGRIWDVASGAAMGEAFRFSSNLTQSVLAVRGERLLLYSSNRMELRDSQTGKIAFSKDIPAAILGAGFDPLNRWMFCLTRDKVTLWDIQSGRLKHSLTQAGFPNHAEFSRDGRYLAVSCGYPQGNIDPCAAQVWDPESGRPVGKPLQHYDDVLWVSFNENGDQVVTASEDRTAQIWSIPSGERCGPLLKHLHHVIHAAFSPDGRLLVTSSRKRAARVWDVRTGNPITPPLEHPLLVSAHFVGRGRNILTVDPKSAQWWTLTPDHPSIDDLLLLTRLLSGDQSVEYGSALPSQPDEFEAGWKSVVSRMPAGFFTVSPDQIRLWTDRINVERASWHHGEALQCEQYRQWFAAVFHLERLLDLRPEDSLVSSRLAAAREQLARESAGANPYPTN
ncbi:MAG TPA: protein kinase [Candidatus Paceibacterota bacterium]|nr:protein kinase [Candidatus Paceibacterota bacterium]